MRLFILIYVLIAFPSVAGLTEECELAFGNLGAPMNERVLQDLNDDLIATQNKISAEDAGKWNYALVSALNSMPVVKRNPKRIYGLTKEQRSALYNKVAHDPVVSPEFLKKYDPSGKIGFCFGRAFVAYVEALRMGLAKENILKLWVVGNMKYKSINWAYHVTTIVRGDDGQWYAIDPEFREPFPIGSWYENIANKLTNDGRLQLFATDPKRFGPNGGGDARPPRPSSLHNPIYNHYFEDYLKNSRSETQEVMNQHHGAVACSMSPSPAKLLCWEELLKQATNVFQSQETPGAQTQSQLQQQLGTGR
jgi:hypothetical protein